VKRETSNVERQTLDLPAAGRRKTSEARLSTREAALTKTSNVKLFISRGGFYSGNNP